MFLLFIFYLTTGCSEEKTDPLFIKLNPSQTGITFSNDITSTDNLNVQDYPFIYNGGGVAIGDINNNGLPDLFFAGNMVSSRLYLNKGNMQFEDITESAGVSTNVWASGASMVDINGNGFLDIYVSVSGISDTPAEERANLLFINNGDGTFIESSVEYNLADTSFTTHAAFLDYNRTGYLDIYLLNNSPNEFSRGERQESIVESGSSVSYDKLYKNNGDETFSDVSIEAGLLDELGYGLGIAVTDINRNGWPDIYISNDILPNDVLYVNNGNGTFTDQSNKWLKHTSYSGMDVDIADFNNDGWPDILQVDMMPEELTGRKRVSGATTYAYSRELISGGSQYQYPLNTLQLSNGIEPNGDLVFSEIARQAGVAYTDWSWSSLFADFNNTGLKDILITNGFPKAVNDFDYQISRYFLSQMNNTRSSEVKQRRLQLIRDLRSIELPNYIFQNDGDIGFLNKTDDWGLIEKGFSYGAAYVDLNNNGKLDIVINNINAPASVYENVGKNNESTHYLTVRLSGEYPNSQGIGSEVILTTGEKKQYIYQSPFRGYASTVDDRIHFGLGDDSHIDSLEVYWVDGRYQLFTDISANQLINIEQHNAVERKKKLQDDENRPKFVQVPAEQSINWRHRENDFVDFNIQTQLPHQLSRLGPALASGDVTGNGLDDVYIGGATGQAGTLFLQQQDGNFVESSDLQPWGMDRDHEDIEALFFDANGNGLQDLYVTSGGYENYPASQLQQDRLYINRGGGRFYKDEDALPEMHTSSSVVTPGDIDGDGRMDLFVGGRLVPLKYPYPAKSYILRNEGGEFRDITADVAPGLVEPGLITDAAWVDFDKDGQLDLVTTGIWLPVQFYRNEGGEFREVTDSVVDEPQRGWWYSLAVGDFNKNGYKDIIAGNLGLNHTFTTSPENPFGVYAADFNKNRQMDIFFTKQKNSIDNNEGVYERIFSNIFGLEVNSSDYPFFGLAKTGLEYNDHFLQRFQSFEAFSDVEMEQLFSSRQLEQAIRNQTDTFSSVYLQNNGNRTFSTIDLPSMTQIFPVKSIISHDVDGDDNLDLIIAGNIYETDPEIPRADAGNGLWLKGDGVGNFTPISPFESGFLAPGDVKALTIIKTPVGHSIVVANNNDLLDVFSISP